MIDDGWWKNGRMRLGMGMDSRWMTGRTEKIRERMKGGERNDGRKEESVIHSSRTLSYW